MDEFMGRPSPCQSSQRSSGRSKGQSTSPTPGPSGRGGTGLMKTALDSPCLGVCVIDARTDTCFGCFRTPKEIARWPRWSEEARRETLKKLKQRRKNEGLPPLAFYEEVKLD